MMKQVLLIHLFPPTLPLSQAKEDVTELYRLVESLGDAKIIDMIYQRGYPAKGAYIGTGKAQEAALYLNTNRIDIVLLNGIAKPRQLYRLWNILSKEQPSIIVWDRVDVILHIFQKHAHTAEAKLQIELANMRHMGPRIYGMGNVLSQQAGGIGTRGIGETNVELMKRHWKQAIRRVQKKLSTIQKTKEVQIEHRKQLGYRTVSLVGYTNAGKTTLFNRLTKKKRYANNLLFATLDSTSGKLFLPTLRKECIVTDTIGFIQDLPPSLIDAFHSTLMESLSADMLIHVLDGSSESVFLQCHVVEEILHELGADDQNEIIVVNKAETLSQGKRKMIAKRLTYMKPLFVSAKTGEGIDALIERIEMEMVNENSQISDRTQRKTLVLPTMDTLSIGSHVAIIQKHDQEEGRYTEGVIKRILSHGYNHPHGIKVELESGEIGRVQKVL